MVWDGDEGAASDRWHASISASLFSPDRTEQRLWAQRQANYIATTTGGGEVGMPHSRKEKRGACECIKKGYKFRRHGAVVLGEPRTFDPAYG